MPGDFCGDSFAQNDVEIVLITDQVETELSVSSQMGQGGQASNTETP